MTDKEAQEWVRRDREWLATKEGREYIREQICVSVEQVAWEAATAVVETTWRQTWLLTWLQTNLSVRKPGGGGKCGGPAE